MANNQENNNEKEYIAVGIRLKSDVHEAVSTIMADDNRNSIANTVEHLLVTHQRIKKVVRRRAEAATATA